MSVTIYKKSHHNPDEYNPNFHCCQTSNSMDDNNDKEIFQGSSSFFLTVPVTT
jgi:hypothetical protein